jgi:hypothetical protein
MSGMKRFVPTYADWQVQVTYRAITATKKEKPHVEPAAGNKD